MITKRTITPFPVLDKRENLIGTYKLYLKVEEVAFNEVNAVCKGFYYYINESEEVIVRDRFSIIFTWDDVMFIEDNMLPDINSPNLKLALFQRILEFTNLQIQVESGQNYGTTFNDWEDI